MRASSLFLLLSVVVAGCGGTVGGDDASTDTALDAAPACRTDGDCDDGLFCDGVERCVSGTCAAGTATHCDDMVACTTDTCSEPMRACVFRVPDADGDGAGAASCVDGTGTPLGNDCNDADANRFPTNREVCDAAMHDEDCDDATHGGVDADGDGFEDHRCCDGTHCGDDCDDGHATAHPGATETCNLVDDDCNGMVDEGVSTPGFVDADRDGFGDPTMPLSACSTAANFAADGTDCDDTDPARNPAQVEFCDGVDNDCNGAIDDHTMDITWYRDADDDGFGSATSGTTVSCTAPTGYALRGTDCNDASAGISPAAPELCNGIDDDCNGAPDFVIAAGDLEDDDRDGVADLGCGAPLGRDCDDHDATSGPGTVEACDGRDNDCDTRIDEGAIEVAFYRDADGDGFGDASVARVGCTQPAGFAPRGGDCDDTLAARSPGASEACNAVDDDCDGAIDEGPASTACASGPGSLTACVAGACTLVGCATGYADCSAPAGCETDLRTSADHCGSCVGCAEPLSSCSVGACRPLLGPLTAIEPTTGTGNVETERVLTVPSSTDLIVLGRFSGSVGFGGVRLTSLGGYDGFAARVRRNGTVVWQAQWGGTGDDAIHAAAMLPDGSAFVVGGEMCNANLCGGPLTGCYGFWQRFPSALAGGCNYASGFTATTVAIRALAMEQVGTTIYVYGAGTFSGVGSSGLGTSVGDVDGFVFRARERPSMQPLIEWAHPFGDVYVDVPEDIALDGTDSLAVGGYTANSTDFGAGPTAHAGYDDAFVVQFARATGAYQSGGQFGTNTGDDHVRRLLVAPDGQLLVLGYASNGNLVLGGRTLLLSGAHNLFAFSLTGATARWARGIAGDVDPGGLGLSGTNVLISGSYNGALTLDRGTLTNGGGRSAFLLSVDGTTGESVFARATSGGSGTRSLGTATGSDGTIAWEIDYTGFVSLGGSALGGVDQDMAMVVVTP